MIRLTNSSDDAMIVLNPARIFVVKESLAGTSIMSAGGDTVYVKETMKQVESRIEDAKRKAYAKKKEASAAAKQATLDAHEMPEPPERE